MRISFISLVSMFLVVLISHCETLNSVFPAGSTCSVVVKKADQTEILHAILEKYFSIGFLTLDLVASLAKPGPAECSVQYGKMINAMGTTVEASVETIKNSVLIGPTTCPGRGLCTDIFDTTSSNGWPISFLSYIAIPTKIEDTCATSTSFDISCLRCLKQKTTYDYLSWILNSPEATKVLEANFMAAMPPYVVSRITSEILSTIRCAGSDGQYTFASAWPTDVQAFRLIGGGSSIQSNVQVALANAFNIDTSVSVSFLAGAGHQAPTLATDALDFEFLDLPATLAASDAAAGSPAMVPILAAAVVPVYNLERRRGVDPLIFTREALAGVFLASVTSWADPALAGANSAAAAAGALPPQALLRVVSGEVDPPSTGAPAAFVKALRAFANLSAGDEAGPDPEVMPANQVWPAQALPYIGGVVCGNKVCATQVCQPGSYFEPDANTCTPCPLGQHALSAGSTACAPCPPGSFSGARGARSCTKCNDVSYQPLAGTSTCLTCPANTRRFGVLPKHSLAAASFDSVSSAVHRRTDEAPAANALDTSDSAANIEFVYGSQRSECMCLVGFWLPSSVNASGRGGEACLPCPEGASCMGFVDGEQTIPVPKVNFWADPANPSAMFECSVGRCMEGYACMPGWTGRHCSAPAPGHYLLAGQLKNCEDSTPRLVIFLMILEILAWIMLVNFACSQYHSLAIDMIMLQTSGYIAKISLRWHPDLDVIRILAEFFNFEIGYVGLECNNQRGWIYENLFFWQLSFPFLSVALCALWWIVKYNFRLIRRSRRYRAIFNNKKKALKVVRVMKNKTTLASVSHTSANLFDYVWIKFIMFFITWYPVLVYTACTVFVCEDDAYGVAHLVTIPELQCWSGSHWSMVFLSCTYIPVVLVAIPLYLARQLYWGLKADLLNRCSFMECYGWIYTRYKSEYAWWELIMLLRRALVCVCAAFVTVPMVSACLIIFVLNIFLCLQLVCSPQLQQEIRLLEVGSLFSCMLQAVAGVLLYPSLDASNQCVGSTYLDQIGSACATNQVYKRSITLLVLLVFSLNLITSILLFICKFHSIRVAGWALRDIHRTFDIPYDKYDIHLSNLIKGPYLAALLKDKKQCESQVLRERFVRLNDAIPYFIMFNHNVSGLFSQSEYAKTLNGLLANFPGLLDWISQADRKLVQGFCTFASDYSAYAKEHHRVTFGEIILTAHKADVLIWLMTCSDSHRQAFCRLLLGVASASGMNYFLRPGKIRDKLLEETQRHSMVGDAAIDRLPSVPSATPGDETDAPASGVPLLKPITKNRCSGTGSDLHVAPQDCALMEVIRTGDGDGNLTTEAMRCAAITADASTNRR